MPSGSNSNRVSNKDLYDAITRLRLELKEDIGCLDSRVDDLVKERGEMAQRVVAAETIIKSLNRRVSAWDIGNTVGVLFAGILAYFGIRN
jgi:transposase